MIYLVLFVLFEAFVIIACIYIAKKMVKNRTGLAKKMVIGMDDEQTIEKMKNMAKEIARTGKFEMSDKFDGYEVEVKAKEKCIGEIVIKSPKTKVSYDFKDGLDVKNLAWTEKGAVVDIALTFWLVGFCIQFFVAFIAWMVYMQNMINGLINGLT